ncbi:MAG: CRISPR-associated endonuclease Cas2 [Gammaproteobacteria bacterium]
MAFNRKRLYLIAYDIADAKRLNKTHRVLKKSGMPVQYSVFTTVMSRAQLQRLLDRIECIIDPREDDVRCYGLPDKVECDTVGRQYFPGGVMLFSAGINRLLGDD